MDVKDRVAASIVDVRSGEGSTVRFYNAAEEEFMKVRTNRVSERFQPLFDEKLLGVRHAEDGRLYAILETDTGEAPHLGGGRGIQPDGCDGEPDGAVRGTGVCL